MKKVLITGGNGGIAQAIKKELEKAGFDVYAPSHSEMDVTDTAGIEKAVKGYVPDILINNAGYVVPGSIRECDLDNTRKQIAIDLEGVFFCTEIALKYNPELEIINIGSAAAVETHADWSEYCASKAGVVMATRCWAEDGLYAVVISPGRTDTKMRSDLFHNEDKESLLDPADFAKVVLKAVNREYKAGEHIIVKKQNVEELLR